MGTHKVFVIYPLLILGLILVFAASCKKDEDKDKNEGSTFTDSRDGSVYQIVTIGNQVWMAENLRYLPFVAGPGTSSTTYPQYYVYDYNGTDINVAKATANYTNYGVLYNWIAAMGGSPSSNSNPSGVQGVCPTGWHLPSDAEWTEMTDYLGGISGDAGGKLKETGTIHWSGPNTGATNESGFTALPGGSLSAGYFRGISQHSSWWSATQESVTYSWFRSLYFDNNNVNRTYFYRELGFSVRCVRD